MLSADHFDAKVAERLDHFLSSSLVGDEYVKVLGCADLPPGYYAKLAVIDDSDFSLSVPYHRPVQVGFIGAEACGSPVRIDAVGAKEKCADNDVLQTVRCRGANKREPVPAQITSGHKHIQVFTFRQLHGDVDGVCDDGDVVVERKGANYFGRGCAGRQSDGVPGLDERSGRAPDAALLVGETFDLRLERTVVAKWLVEQRLQEFGSAVRAS
jgi:hypothetical protein